MKKYESDCRDHNLESKCKQIKYFKVELTSHDYISLPYLLLRCEPLIFKSSHIKIIKGFAGKQRSAKKYFSHGIHNSYIRCYSACDWESTQRGHEDWHRSCDNQHAFRFIHVSWYRLTFTHIQPFSKTALRVFVNVHHLAVLK